MPCITDIADLGVFTIFQFLTTREVIYAVVNVNKQLRYMWRPIVARRLRVDGCSEDIVRAFMFSLYWNDPIPTKCLYDNYAFHTAVLCVKRANFTNLMRLAAVKPHIKSITDPCLQMKGKIADYAALSSKPRAIYQQMKQAGFSRTIYTVLMAIREGAVDLLQEFNSSDIAATDIPVFYLVKAMQSGNAELLDWLHVNGLFSKIINRTTLDQAMRSRAGYKSLRWLAEKKYKWAMEYLRMIICVSNTEHLYTLLF